jgi:hypothetical protein
MEILKYYNKRRRLHENTTAPCLELQEDNDSYIKITSWGGTLGCRACSSPWISTNQERCARRGTMDATR